MKTGIYHSKIRQVHLEKKAIVYLRQSSQKQVIQNTESQKLQYALAERAGALGFTQIEVICRTERYLTTLENYK